LGITKISYTEKQLATIANHISKQERVAMDAEREFYKIKSVRYMQGKEGMLVWVFIALGGFILSLFTPLWVINPATKTTLLQTSPPFPIVGSLHNKASLRRRNLPKLEV